MLLAMVKVQEAELESKGHRRSGVLGDDQGWCAESCGFFSTDMHSQLPAAYSEAALTMSVVT